MKTPFPAGIALLVTGMAASAQQPAADTTKSAPPSASTAVDFSGVLFANFQYRGDKGRSKSQNKFDLERVYLTFRAQPGERVTIRITADVFQQTSAANDAFYRGWVIRAKYAYLQYDLIKNRSWTTSIRGGLLHNVVIDHIESFWPRWLSPSPVDRSGFFSSADAGIAGLLTLPKKWGEFYATVVNGPGYTSRETDRFKDYAARLSITPLSAASIRLIQTLTLTGWTYVGAVGSSFADGVGQTAPVGSSLPRTRAGLFVGLRDPRLSAGVEWDTRKDGGEIGDNTPASPRIEFDSTGRLVAGFVAIKPLQLLRPGSRFPLGVVGRWDRLTPNTQTRGFVDTIIAGLTWDLDKKTAVSIDYQEQSPRFGASLPAAKTYFVHLLASF